MTTIDLHQLPPFDIEVVDSGLADNEIAVDWTPTRGPRVHVATITLGPEALARLTGEAPK